MSIRETAFDKIEGRTNRAKVLSALGVKRIYPGIPVVQHAFTKPTAIASVEVEIEKLLIAGKPIPADIAAPIVAAEKYDTEQLARVQAIDAVARRYADDSAETTAEATNAALEYLHTEMQRVIQSVKEQAAELDGMSSAGQVIKAGGNALEAWRALGQLAEEYNEIRAAQREITHSLRVNGNVFTNEMFNRTAMFADAIDVMPYWVEQRRTYALQNTDNNADVDAYRGWLGAVSAAPAFDDGLEAEHQMILIATTTTPWVPTHDQFVTADAAAMYAVGKPTYKRLTDMEQARIRYYDTTGVKHKHTISEHTKRPFSRAV
jgi:hypothetical protein